MYCQNHPQAQLVKKKNRWGKYFYGCPRYPDCRYVLNSPPEEPEEGKVGDGDPIPEVLDRLQDLVERVKAVESGEAAAKQEILAAIADLRKGINYLLDVKAPESDKMVEVNKDLHVAA